MAKRLPLIALSKAHDEQTRALFRQHNREVRQHYPKESLGSIRRRILGQPERSTASVNATWRVLQQGVRPKLGRTTYNAPRNKTGGVYNIYAEDEKGQRTAMNIRIPEGTSKFAVDTSKGRRRFLEEAKEYTVTAKVRCGEIDTSTLTIKGIKAIAPGHTRVMPIIVRNL